MTDRRHPGQGAVLWLTAQAVLFGAMAALLGIVANAMFLDAYGSGWLPATYIVIGAAGVLVSGAVARTARSHDLVRIALAVLGAASVGLGLSWVVAARGDAPWVSVPLLVLFPILIQLGFVFIGGQGGRLLDIAGIKAYFPRIMAGFPVGAVLGGIVGGQLVEWSGRTEDLLLATAVVQTGFTGLVWATGRRYRAQLGPVDAPGARPAADGTARSDDDPPADRSLRHWLGSPFVVLVLAYQVLSALGSQLADFLVFDRATAYYPDPTDLARFLAGYTAAMNALSIAFLFLLAGPLLRRFGLRLGIAANPLVLTVLIVGVAIAFVLGGAGSLALLAAVSAARIADIALTDGTTRTSINAIYQVIPERGRLSVQAAVEGMGVPLAIGISGALILVLNALPFALAATIGVTALVCAVWTVSAVLLYRAYGPALVEVLRRRPLLVPAADIDATVEDEAVARRLLSSPDPRSPRLGLDLLSAMASPTLITELGALVDDPHPDVRLAALAGLAASDDEPARRRLADEVWAGAASTDPAVRLRAAQVLGVLGPAERSAASALLGDADPAVRSAAFDGVQAGDDGALAAAIAGLEDVRSMAAASSAVGRLGDAVLPALAARLADGSRPAPPDITRLVRSAATRTPARDELLRRHVRHPDRELGLAVLERLIDAEPIEEDAAAALDEVLLDDVRHAAQSVAAIAALTPGGDPASEADAPLVRALHDELDQVRRRVLAGRLVRHGSERLGPALVGLGRGGPGDALAAEALEVMLVGPWARYVPAVLLPDLAVAERARRLPPVDGAPPDVEGWLRDITEDPDDRWRSPWLRACAIHAARGRGLLERMDLAAARAAGDPLIDEVLGSDSGPRPAPER